MISALKELGASVIAAFGFQRATNLLSADRRRREFEVPVTAITRCPEGMTRPLSGKGAGRRPEPGGAVNTPDLSGPKARLLATVLSGSGLIGSEFGRLFLKSARASHG